MSLPIPHEAWAQWYDLAYEEVFGESYHWLTDEAVRTIVARSDPGANILDLGAGTGRLAIPLAKQGFQIHAIDQSPAMLHQLHVKAVHHGVGPRITTQCVSVADHHLSAPADVALLLFTVIIYLTTTEELRRTCLAIGASVGQGGSLFLDLPRASLFSGYIAETERVRREVRVSRTASSEGHSMFEYEEETWIKPPHYARYVERFPVVDWPEPTVLGLLDAAGFDVAEDLSRDFSRVASRHWWLRKR